MSAGRRLRKKCPTTGKVGYRDKPAAEWGMGWMNKRMDDSRAVTARIIAVYRCPFCPAWHLTSHPQVFGQPRAEPPGSLNGPQGTQPNTSQPRDMVYPAITH